MKSQKVIRREAETALHDCIRHAVGAKSQTEIAKLLGVTPQYVCDMMNGRRKWGPERLDLLAIKLGIPDVLNWHRLGARANGWRIQ